MGSLSIWHWAIVAALLALVGVPVSRILRRLGFSGWWTILAFVPWVNLIGLWVIAFVRWPKDRAVTPDRQG